MTLKEIREKIGISCHTLGKWICEYNIPIRKRYRWSNNEKEILKDLYPNGKKKEMMDSLKGRTWKSIMAMAHRMNLFFPD